MDDPGSSSRIILLVVLLGLSGFFSALETAVMSVGRLRIKTLSQNGDYRARLVQRMRAEPGRFLAPILIGNNLVNIAATSIVTAIALELFGNDGLGVAVAVSTVAIVLVGEILPKSLAASSPEKVSMSLARPGMAAVKLLYPLSWIFSALVRRILKLGGAVNPEPYSVTHEELESAVEAAEESGSLDSDESQMIQGIFKFGDTTVSDVMIPRLDILAVSADVRLSEAADLFLKGHFSRIPVFSGNLDNIIGFVHVKDLFRTYLNEPDTPVRSLARPILFVPATKKVDDVFNQMRVARLHVAVALDEYGATAGLVTMEDILEEIVGDIMDEYDPPEEPIRADSDGSYVVDGRVSLDEVEEELGIDLHDGDIDTVGGLVFHELGKIPKPGDRSEIGGVTLEVTEMKGRRVAKVRMNVKRGDQNLAES